MKTISPRFNLLAALFSLGVLCSACSGDGWTRNMGVVGTGNAGRVRVAVRTGQKDIARSGIVVFLRRTDSLPVELDSCGMTLDSACHFSPDSTGVYLAELWVAGRITGRSGWFHLAQADLDLDLTAAAALQKFVEHGDQALLLFQRAQQVAQAFLGEVQIESDEV